MDSRLILVGTVLWVMVSVTLIVADLWLSSRSETGEEMGATEKPSDLGYSAQEEAWQIIRACWLDSTKEEEHS